MDKLMLLDIDINFDFLNNSDNKNSLKGGVDAAFFFFHSCFQLGFASFPHMWSSFLLYDVQL